MRAANHVSVSHACRASYCCRGAETHLQAHCFKNGLSFHVLMAQSLEIFSTRKCAGSARKSVLIMLCILHDQAMLDTCSPLLRKFLAFTTLKAR